MEDNIDITQSDSLVDFEIEDNCYVNDKFIGTTVSKKISVNVLNPSNKIDLENKEIQAFAGIKINNVEEVVPFGNFIIQKPDNEEVKEKTSFIGYDYMIKFNKSYKNRGIFPCKASVAFQDVCDQVGLVAGSLDFTNCNYVILGNPFTNNEDCRTVLSNLAQLAGGFAKIGRDNKVYIISLKNISNLLRVKDVNAMTVKELNLTLVKLLFSARENADESLDGNNYFEDFAKNKQWGEINSVILRLSGTEGENTVIQDDESILKNGLTELVIEDNYFLINQQEREKVIQPLWEDLKGIKYLPFKTKYYGYPYLDSGDMIYVQDTNGTGYISYVFNHTFKFNGAFNGSLNTPALSKTQTAYKNIVNTRTKFKQTERKIDKINGVINDIVEEQTDMSYKLSQITQNIDSITQTVKETLDFTEEVEGTNELLLKDSVDFDILKFVAKGRDVAGAITFNENLKFANNLYPKFAGQTITVVVDTNSRANPSQEKKEYSYEIEPLHNFNNVFDEFVIECDGKLCTVKILRYLKKSGSTYTILTIPEEEILDENVDIKMFKGVTYLYLKEYTNWDMKATYMSNPNLNEYYASKVELETQIKQTSEEIELTASKTIQVIDEDLKNNYSTKTETADAKTEAINSANSNTENKLKQYPTTTQMNSAITQKADSITQSVSKTYSTKIEMENAKTEAINSANSSTNTKLEDYTTTNKLGTFIEQNWEYIKYAWNQISQYLKLEGIDGKATLNIYDDNDNMLMSLSQNGQDFFDSSGNKIGRIGIISQDNKDILAFAMPVDWEHVDTSRSMAWGIIAPDKTFLPVFYLAGYYGDENSEYGGELIVEGKLTAHQLEVAKSINIDSGGLVWNDNKYYILPLPSFDGANLREWLTYKAPFGHEFFCGDTSIFSMNSETIYPKKPFYIPCSNGAYEGYPMIGINKNNKYYCYWDGGDLYFYADGTYVGTISDKRLKSEIQQVDDKFLNAINELEIKQFKANNRKGLISFGIIAQDLIEVFEKYDIKPQDYEILGNIQYNLEEDKKYYTIEYTQFLILKQLANDKKIKDLEEKDKKKDNLIQDLIKRIENLERRKGKGKTMYI